MSEKYKSISVWGAGCYTDAYIYDDDERLSLISLFGRPGITKAIVASFLTIKSLQIRREGNAFTTLHKPYNKCQIYTSNQDGLCHKIIVVPDYFYGEQSRIIDQDDRDRIFNFVDSSVSTPLKKEWADWLLKQEIIESNQLYGFGNFKDVSMERCRLYFAPESEKMDEIILEGIRNGEIS